MDTVISYLMLSLISLSFICFALGTAARLSSWTGGHKRTSYWSHIFSGIGFLLFAVSGFCATPYLEGSARWITPVAGVLMALLGVFLTRMGLFLRREALKSS